MSGICRFITRSGIVMLCAAWERYNEDLLLESINIVCDNINDIKQLPKSVSKMLSSKVKSHKNELKPLELSGEGWKTLWKEFTVIKTEALNTPNSTNLIKLYNKYLGLDDYTRNWTFGSINIDLFVATRGEIAHNGNKAKYARIDQLRSYQDQIISNVINIDSKIANDLTRLANLDALPWELNYSRNLSYYK